ncbi:MAG: anti-sigma factor family protein [Pyrinomonadaceae bacterium]
MKCREVRLELHQMVDETLDADRNNAISDHLLSCPLCRDELSAINQVRQELRSMRRPELSGRMLQILRRSVSTNLKPSYGFPSFQLVGGSDVSWLHRWLMPTMTGAVASLVLGVALLAVILMPSDVPQLAINTDPNSQNGDPLFLANIDPGFGDQLITPQQFARSRADVAPESPSINPSGTLVAMTNSDTRVPSRDEEVVVVAEVFGDGLARITNVVESSRDQKKMDRLQAAFRRDRISPPFVPASMDNRGDMVRVVLKFQSVNVNIDDGGSFR